jgi:hypothetical protein
MSAITVGEETVVVNETTGARKASKIARFDLVPSEAMWAVAEVYGHGSTKYDDNNWRKGYNWGLSIAALERHLARFKAGEDIDPEFGLPHMAHAAWHCLALITFMAEHPELDDRWKGPTNAESH